MLAFFLAYAAVCLYNTGNNWSLQLVHYPLYAMVGEATFGAYMARQNRLETVPAIIPGAAQFVMGFVLLAVRPAGVPLGAAVAGAALNVVVIAATVIWAARLNVRLERGFDPAALTVLLRANLVRALCYTAQAGLILWLLYRLIPH